MSDYGLEKDVEQSEFDQSDEDHLSEDNESSTPKSKRARTGEAKPKPQRKKYVRGKLGGLKGIMQMPLEIFAEIACHITPGDLISMIRTNKFFRQMLLKRSALSIWQCAQRNVPGLPPCLTGMSEPQYAALLFTKTCTLCGTSAMAHPDPYLRARLCTTCRDTTLEEVPPPTFTRNINYHFVVASPIIKPKGRAPLSRRFAEKLPWCFRDVLADVIRQDSEFKANNDLAGLAQWEQELKQEVEERMEEAERLQEFIASSLRSRAVELEEAKQERRDAIHEKLIELGWEEKELVFDREHAKSWKALVEVSKPLTERVWTNIHPKLTQLLEENRLRIREAERLQRLHQRHTKLDQLLCNVKREMHPYQAIIDALVTGASDEHKTPSFLEMHFPNPFPQTLVVLEWDLLKDAHEEEISVERVEELFNERRPQLEQKVLEWRADIESRLVESYGTKIEEAGNDVILKVRGNAAVAQQFSPTSRLLLRADTIFKRLPKPGDGTLIRCLGLIAPHRYPIIASSTKANRALSRRTNSSARIDDPEQYVGKVEMSTVAKGLLTSIGMPDATHLELAMMGSVFACGRCRGCKVGDWDTLLSHYTDLTCEWERRAEARPEQNSSYPIVFRDIHDVGLMANSKPLVRILSSAEAELAAASDLHPHLLGLHSTVCILCTLDGEYSNTMELVLTHLEDVHDIPDPKRGLHYRCIGDATPIFTVKNPLWQKEWDKWNETRATAAEGSGADEAASSTVVGL